MRNSMATVNPLDSPGGLGSRKTLLIIVTVVGCIAILWPKVFYPMMFSGGVPKSIKEHRGGTGSKSTCCDVVLDRDHFMNTSITVGEQNYRKTLNLATGEISLRQERPPHLRPDSIHPAMRERGRAIPATQTVPIIDRGNVPSSPPRIVEGRPGPIPGMRPPMGAGSVQQAQPKGSSMGFIMPLYTVGIIAFFLYTIMKLLFKKPIPNAPYGRSRADSTFRKEVFGQDNNGCCKRPGDGSSKLGCCKSHQLLHDIANPAAIGTNGPSSASAAADLALSPSFSSSASDIRQTSREHTQLMEIEKLRRKLEETEREMAKIITEMGCDPFTAKQQTAQSIEPHENSENISSNDKFEIENIDAHQKKDEDPLEVALANQVETDEVVEDAKQSEQLIQNEQDAVTRDRKKRDTVGQRTSVQVVALEATACCVGGKKWCHPSTEIFRTHRYLNPDENIPDPPEPPRSIILEGCLPPVSQVLVTDSETRTENVFDEEWTGSSDPAVVVSSKMTLSLISLDNTNADEVSSDDDEDKQNELEEDTEPEIEDPEDDEELDDEEDEENGPEDEEDEQENSDKDDSPLDEDMEIINGADNEVPENDVGSTFNN